MPKLVVNGAMLKCSEGLAPSNLVVLPGLVEADGKPIATVEDYKPMSNIPPFGMCKTQANPQVAAATAAAQGAPTPMPCVPVINAAWSPGAATQAIDDKKLLTVDSSCNCIWSGKIEISDAGTEVDSE